jgi:hypothetical protein
MDVNSNDKMEYLSRPSNFIKKCRNCGSVYITEKECEACGFQLQDPDLGSPVDERSFYSLREDFYNRQNFFEKMFRIERGQKFKEFRNKLLHRYNTLLKGMESPWSDLNKWNYFHFELLDLTRYLASFSANDIIIDRILCSIRNHPFFHEIKLAVDVSRDNKNRYKSISKEKKTFLFLFLIPTFLILIAPLVFKWIH